jgi:hypothetical protein
MTRSFNSLAFFMGLLLVVTTTATPRVAAEEDNDALTAIIAGLIATHNGALVASFSPDPFIQIPASAVTTGTNIGLKYVPAVLSVPGDSFRVPNSPDSCFFQFQLPQTRAEYSNLFGIHTSGLPDDWGALTDFSDLIVAHANSAVNVSVRNRYIQPAQDCEGQPAFCEEDPAQQVLLPSGQHRMAWRAETQLSPWFDVIFPVALLGFNIGYYGASWADDGADATRILFKQQEKKRQIFEWAVTALNLGLDFADVIETQTTAVHEREQLLTVYKIVPPEIATDQPVISLEASDFGGVLYERVRDQLRASIDASDPCGKPFTLGNDAGPLLNIGSNTITWTIRDSGPLPGGGFNSDSLVQQIVIEDTQAPILIAPPSRVIEIPASDPGLDADQVGLGAARVVDLADPDPGISNNGPTFYPINSRSPITWTATDGSGNASQADQLITIKEAGSNTPPVVTDVQTSTLTSEPVDVVLTGSDSDFLDGRFDPLSFRISDRPDNGEFIAPLYPYFIEDYRTSPGGPYGEAFYLSGNRAAWLYDNVCQTGSGPNADRIRVDWVYEPEFVIVDDSGEAFMQDFYWQCSASDATSRARISRWDRDGNFIGQITYEGDNGAFVLDRDGFIYEFAIVGSGSSREIVTNRCSTGFIEKDHRPDFCESLGSVDDTSVPIMQNSNLSYTRVDSSQGILYVTDKRRIFAFDIRNDPADPIYLATLNETTPFPSPASSCAGASRLGYAMDIDSVGNLYMSNCGNERIEKFTASYFDEDGQFVAGDYVGWMGRCETSSNNACDEDKQISKGYACTDATCTRTDLNGEEPGQFSAPIYIAIDPNDVLYVADWDNFRVQRFAPDGSFAGQALSTGSGVNQGEQPGFVLGNMGRPRTVSVNSTQFYIVDTDENFVHVFETSPLKDITDDSVTVTYVSNFDFHSATDSFQFIASDGLHDSNVGTVSIDVARNFRPPIAQDQVVSTNEDAAVQITLSAEDPDGIVGFDFNGLDILDFEILESPEAGSLTILGSDNRSLTLLYAPDADFFGQDRFTFVANDGFDDSNPAEVVIDVAAIDDQPVLTEAEVPERIGVGFPFTYRAEFSDDGSQNVENYVTTLTWVGDGQTETMVRGEVNEDDPDAPFLEGVLLVEPPRGNGTGLAIAENSFTTPGTKNVTICLSDPGATGATAPCLETVFLVEELVNLGIDLPDDLEETAPPAIPSGDSFTIDIVVSNLQPSGAVGLIAQAVSMEGTISTPGVVFTGSSEGACTIGPGGQTIACDFGDFAAGEQRSVTLSFDSEPGLLDDEQVDIALSVTTSSEAINQVTEVFLVRDLRGERIFRDRFIQP